ncbi:hypothetical protein ANCDUO_22026 [Ancylostoma duodenale]|uniref:PH domain-containing protein n=1 Tax=Ancylostoma duodenale TaxID=51022 RepID=A0A0C2FMK8_9BILA|nr:hypothetical protein ANCDUO_22026 [Ancylostoma duodenale]
MNFLEEKTQGWTRRSVVVRRPYILLFRDEKDLVSHSRHNQSGQRTCRILGGSAGDAQSAQHVFCVYEPSRVPHADHAW